MRTSLDKTVFPENNLAIEDLVVNKMFYKLQFTDYAANEMHFKKYLSRVYFPNLKRMTYRCEINDFYMSPSPFEIDLGQTNVSHLALDFVFMPGIENKRIGRYFLENTTFKNVPNDFHFELSL